VGLLVRLIHLPGQSWPCVQAPGDRHATSPCRRSRSTVPPDMARRRVGRSGIWVCINERLGVRRRLRAHSSRVQPGRQHRHLLPQAEPRPIRAVWCNTSDRGHAPQPSTAWTH